MRPTCMLYVPISFPSKVFGLAISGPCGDFVCLRYVTLKEERGVAGTLLSLPKLGALKGYPRANY